MHSPRGRQGSPSPLLTHLTRPLACPLELRTPLPLSTSLAHRWGWYKTGAHRRDAKVTVWVRTCWWARASTSEVRAVSPAAPGPDRKFLAKYFLHFIHSPPPHPHQPQCLPRGLLRSAPQQELVHSNLIGKWLTSPGFFSVKGTKAQREFSASLGCPCSPANGTAGVSLGHWARMPSAASRWAQGSLACPRSHIPLSRALCAGHRPRPSSTAKH